MRFAVTGLASTIALLLVASAADARTVLFVHGRNSGTSDTSDYWHIGYGSNNDGVAGFTGGNQYPNYVYAYDATNSWSDLSSDTRPVCALTEALNSSPDGDNVLLAHSAGGMVAVYMMSVAQNGWATSCNISPATARQWVTNIQTVAAPFRGAQVADAVYGGTSGNWLQIVCGTVAGSIANLLFNEASNMTWALQRSYMGNSGNWNALTGYGSFSSLYMAGGSSRGGDDGTALGAAQMCAGEESNNDGFVSVNSAYGAAKGSGLGTVGMPGGHGIYYAGVSHSSNRRNDYGSFATYVWNAAPW